MQTFRSNPVTWVYLKQRICRTTSKQFTASKTTRSEIRLSLGQLRVQLQYLSTLKIYVLKPTEQIKMLLVSLTRFRFARSAAKTPLYLLIGILHEQPQYNFSITPEFVAIVWRYFTNLLLGWKTFIWVIISLYLLDVVGHDIDSWFVAILKIRTRIRHSYSSGWHLKIIKWESYALIVWLIEWNDRQISQILFTSQRLYQKILVSNPCFSTTNEDVMAVKLSELVIYFVCIKRLLLRPKKIHQIHQTNKYLFLILGFYRQMKMSWPASPV